MSYRSIALIVSLLASVVACSSDNAGTSDSATGDAPAAEATPAREAQGDWAEIVPGLDMRITRDGSGETARAGQIATVHYTGWLYDADAPDGRGQKFDSSVDRDQHFDFPLGAGRVIRGWDEGVVGMAIGEKRELRIAPEMAYGDRQVGDVIGPGSTLLFEVELAGLDGSLANP